MKLNFQEAERLLREEAHRAKVEPTDPIWEARLAGVIELASQTNKTFIAAIGTGLLAKATDLRANPLALKVKGGAPGAHSARSLAKDVLAAHAVELDIDLGVTGREPLNNQPFFRYDLISLDMDVKPNARPALELLVSVLRSVAAIDTEREARAALRTFLSLRRWVRPGFVAPDNGAPSSTVELARLVSRWVSAASEGGRRAQAAAAGLYSLANGSDRVITSRINDPDRHFPGDLVVRRAGDVRSIAEVIEVRDKPVPSHDCLTFLSKVNDRGCDRATVLAVAAGQPPIDMDALASWASQRGMAVRVRYGWDELVRESVFAAPGSVPDACADAYTFIGERLTELEVSDAGIATWIAWRPLHDS